MYSITWYEEPQGSNVLVGDTVSIKAIYGLMKSDKFCKQVKIYNCLIGCECDPENGLKPI